MNLFFAPAFALLGRLGTGGATFLHALLYSAAVAAALLHPGAGDWTVGVSAALLAAGLYFSAANAAWTRSRVMLLSSAAEPHRRRRSVVPGLRRIGRGGCDRRRAAVARDGPRQHQPGRHRHPGS